MAAQDPGPPLAPIRIDKWLWHARVFKSRSLASAAVAEGRVRLNGAPLSKPSYLMKPGDVLTLTQGDRLRLMRFVAPGTRRGPAPEAQTLYDDLTPPPADPGAPVPRRGGRPTGKARRDFDAGRPAWLD